MKRAQILVVCMFLCMMFLPAISVNPNGIVSEVNPQSIEGTDSLDEEFTETPSTIPQPEDNVVLSDTPETISYVSSVATNPNIQTLGFIDGKAYGDVGFTITKLQSDDNSDAVFEEVQYMTSAHFNYIFEIDTSQHTSWVQYDLIVEGYASSSPETIHIYYSSTIDGIYSYLGSFLSTDTSRVSKTFPISITTDTIYVQFVHTNVVMFEPVSHWEFDFICVKFYDARTTNDRIKVDKLFDTDNLYPGRGYSTNSFYTFTAYVQDEDGGDTINYVQLKLLGPEEWWVQWTSSAGWEQSLGSKEYIELVTDQCSTTIIGSELRAAFAVQFRFAHPEMTDVEWRLSSESASSSDQDDYSTIYDYLNNPRYVDIHTALEWGATPHFSEDQCDPSSTVDFWGSVKFAASAGSGTGVDVSAVATRTAPSSPLWSGSDTFTNGDFAVACTTYGLAGDVNTFEVTIIDTYTGNTLLGPSSDSLTLDSVVAYDYGSTDGWLGTGSDATIYTKLRYVSDSEATDPITGGSVEWNGEQLVYQNGHWETSVVSADPDTIIYYSITDVTTPEGITTVEKHPNTTVIWDRSIVLSYTVYRTSDDVEIYQVDIGTSMYVDVQLKYEEEGSWVSDGTVVINGYDFGYTGSNGVWRCSEFNPSAVSFLTFDNVVCSGNTPLIDVVNQNGKSATIIWNTIMVELSVDDSYVSITDTVRVWAYVTRAFDSSDMDSGTVTICHSMSGDIAMTPLGSGGLWFADVPGSGVGQLVYYISEVSDPLYNLITVGKGMSFDGSNDYVDCGIDTSLDLTSSLTLSTWFYGDGSSWEDGMYIISKKDVNDAQYALYIHSDGTLRFYYYVNPTLQWIDLETSTTRNTFHHVVVSVSGTTLNCWFDGTLVQDTISLVGPLTSFSSVPLYLGAQKSGTGTDNHFEGFISEARVYNTVLSALDCEALFRGEYPIDTNLRLNLDRTSVNTNAGTWSDQSSSGNDGTIFGAIVTEASIPMINEETVRPIWSQVKVMGYSSDNYDIDVGATSHCHVTLIYTHDNSPVEDGIVHINGLVGVYSGSDGVWNFGDSFSYADTMTYNSVTYTGGLYEIDSVNQNNQDLVQVWDEILVDVIFVPDSFLDLGSEGEIRVSASLTYHSTHVLGSSDVLYMNGEEMSWNPSGYFYYHIAKYEVGTWNFYVNGTNANVTWTGLVIDFSDPFAQIIEVGQNASGIAYTVVYAHDYSSYDGSLALNNTQFSYDVAGRQGYRLQSLIGDDGLGISYIVQDDDTYCTWESVIVSISGPTQQMLLLGQNASGIVVSGIYAYSRLPFNGIFTLNDTVFTYWTEGHKGYTVESVSGDSYNITVISSNDVTFATWLDGYPTEIHISVSSNNILVSTAYDLKCFNFELWITNSTEDMVDGWLNLNIGGNDYSVYSDGITNASFSYYPEIAGDYTFQASFEGDGYYASANEELTGLTVDLRGITYEAVIPSTMVAMCDTSFQFSDLFDDEFSGIYEEITFVNNFPINSSIQIWWTLSELYEDPLTYAGTWSIANGNGFVNWNLPWDLNGDNVLTETDFECFLFVTIDGLGIYEDTIINIPISILQPLQLDLQSPTLVYSDSSTISIQLTPLFDDSFTGNLDLDIELYVSNDNSSWILIDTVPTDADGMGIANWSCFNSSIIFFKAITHSTSYYIECVGYSCSTIGKETTLLSVPEISNFTYSDQGILVAQLTTDDGEPIANYPVFLEIMDGNWISIGSGITNETGYVSILWTPTQPASFYLIQIRALLTESEYYNTPENTIAQVFVSKETLKIDIDTVNQGHVIVKVTDDENEAVEGIPINFYLVEDTKVFGITHTDSEGYARLEINFEDGELLRVEIDEDRYFFGAIEEVEVSLPPDYMILTFSVGGVFFVAIGLAVSRKILRGRVTPSTPTPVSPEVAEALKEERESVPIRVKEHKECRREGLEEIGGENDSSED